MAKCPRCDVPFSEVSLVSMPAISGAGSASRLFPGIAFCCPNVECQAVLGFQIDHEVVMAETVKSVQKVIVSENADLPNAIASDIVNQLNQP